MNTFKVFFKNAIDFVQVAVVLLASVPCQYDAVGSICGMHCAISSYSIDFLWQKDRIRAWVCKKKMILMSSCERTIIINTLTVQVLYFFFITNIWFPLLCIPKKPILLHLYWKKINVKLFHLKRKTHVNC